MTAAAAREVFNAAIASQTDADQIAKIELAREYFTNPDFRARFEEFVWQQNQAQ